MTANDITRAWMEDLRLAIIDRQKALDMRASGRSAASLETEQDGSNTRLMGSKAFIFQEYGRGPTKRKGPIPLHVIIRQWMKDKGLREEGGFNAFSIANKIHREGTRIFRKEVPPLGLETLIRQRLPDLEKQLSTTFGDNIETTVLRQFKRDGNPT